MKNSYPFENQQSLVRDYNKHSYTPIDRIVYTLLKLKREIECKKIREIYLTNSSRKNLQVAIAFCLSKSSNKNVEAIKDIMGFLDQKNAILPPEQTIQLINILLHYFKQDKENYNWEEVRYLNKKLEPLLIQSC